MTVKDIVKHDCQFCGMKDTVITKVDYTGHAVVEIRTKVCYECGALSYKQEQMLEKGVNDL